MTTKRFLRAAIWLIPLALVAVWLVAEGAIGERTNLAHAALFLARGDSAHAQTILVRLQWSFLNADESAYYLKLCRALAGEDVDPDPARVPKDSLVSLSLLMSQRLRAGDYQACLSLSRLAEVSSEKTASLYETASLLESGYPGEAVECWKQVPEGLRATFTGAKIAETLDLISNGAATIVRDRRGALVGWIDLDRHFTPAQGVDPQLIPAPVVEMLVAGEEQGGILIGLDLELSAIAKSALEGRRGSIVLLEPRSGEVMAAVSDERTMRIWPAPAFEQRLEPASIMKVITTVAAMRAGLDPDAEIAKMTCRGAVRFDGGILYCPYTAGPLEGLDQAMAISCNIAFAELGVKVGWQGMVSELRRWGFDSEVANPFPLGGILITQGNEFQLANLSIGLDSADITTAHAALIAAAVANGGVMPKPSLLHGSDGLLGLSPRRRQIDDGERVIEKEWLPVIINSMKAVSSWGGTAAGIAPFGFPAALKTGTGGTYRDGFHINYIGFGPLPRMNVAFCVRVTNLRNSSRARDAGFEVTKRLLTGLRGVARERGWR
jgi:peptidoglycan glycosyltransferase